MIFFCVQFAAATTTATAATTITSSAAPAATVVYFGHNALPASRTIGTVLMMWVLMVRVLLQRVLLMRQVSMRHLVHDSLGFYRWLVLRVCKQCARGGRYRRFFLTRGDGESRIPGLT